MAPKNTITTNPTTFPTPPTPQASSQPMSTTPHSYQTLTTNLFSSSTSSSTASDEELGGGRGGGGKRKRKWNAFFAKLTKEVIGKQEELQAKLLETVERHERERMAREESWRLQEMARINKEHEILLQERSALTAKDNALIAFLQKVSVQGQYNNTQPAPIALPQPPQSLPPPPPSQHWPPLQQPTQPTPLPPAPPLRPVISAPVPLANMEIVQRSETTNVFEIMSSSNRWPKAEVQALISSRTSLDLKYQENGGKGTLWEEVSMGMQKLGYNRNAKKCKEKWENINKYFKKVKDTNKKRGEDSKTCPYFHQLDALYKEKNKNDTSYPDMNPMGSNMVPLMVRPEQQWPPPQQEKVVNESVEGEEEEEEDIDEEEENGD